MNICFFAHHSISGKDGASLSMINIAEEMVLKGHAVYIVYPNHPEHVSSMGGITNIYHRSFTMRKKVSDKTLKTNVSYFVKKLYNCLSCIHLSNMLKQFDLDLVHINGIDNQVGAITAARLNIPYIWHIRQFLEEDLNCTLFDKKYMYQLLNKSSRIIGVSKAVCEKYSYLLNQNVKLVYNGVPQDKYTIGDHAFCSDSINMVLPGRITKEKGQIDAVKAVKILRDRGVIANLCLVGYGVDDYYNQVLQYIKDNELQDQVEIIKYTDDLREIRNRSDIGLICSTKEAFGRVTVENFFSRILCIGSNSGGTAELIDDGRNGLLYESGNYIDLANKIEYAEKPEHREKIRTMIDVAYTDAVKYYSTDKLIEHINQVYAEVLGQ